MMSLHLASVPQTAIKEIGTKEISSIADEDASYRTNFEHNAFEHLDFLNNIGLGHIGRDSDWEDDGYNIFTPDEVKQMANVYKDIDLAKLAKTAELHLKEYDPELLVMIVEKRVIRILNHAVERGEYLVTTFA